MIRTLHRLCACVIGLFVAAHLFNHSLAIGDISAHIGFMRSFRRIYRQPTVEVLLLGALLFQIGSGLFLIRSRWGQRRGFYDRLQVVSGGYLAFFLLNHVGAVLLGRCALNLDTNFYFAAAGLHVTPFHYFFVPYYFLAVLAVFGHVACAFHWLTRAHLRLGVRNRLGYAIISVGASLSLLIVLGLMGALYPVEIPSKYGAPYTELFPAPLK